MRRFKKALIERALGAELTHHLGYAPSATKPDAATNHRNGTTAKTVLTDDGAVDLEVPRDREGTFEPVLIPKHERRFYRLRRQDYGAVSARRARDSSLSP